MPIVTLTSGRSFTCRQNQTILQAAQESDVPMGYSCRNGRCSSCKCKIITGETHATRLELGLTANEIIDGWILGCVRQARSDLLLDAELIDSADLPLVQTLPTKIEKISRLNDTIIRVILRFPQTAQFNFIPGQYINVIGPNGLSRSYSIANNNFASRQLELHIKYVPNGEMSEYWFNIAKVNDLLRIEGPLGSFILRDTYQKDLIFFATGTGIAPIKAQIEHLRWLADDDRPRSVKLFWGARYDADLYLEEVDFTGVDEFVPVLSRPASEWIGASGYVQSAFLSTKPRLADCTVYACGSAAMINGARQILIDSGLSSREFYSEAFVSSNNEII